MSVVQLLRDASPRPAAGAEEQRTRTRLRAAVAERGPVSAARLATLLGLTTTAVRRHLDALTADGLLECRDPHQTHPRGRGRPAREYVVSSAGHDTLAAGYDDLAISALTYLAAVQGKQAVQAFAEQRLAGLEKRLSLAVDSREDIQDRVTALAAALAEQGYAASARPVVRGTAPEGTQLCQGHCPVQRVAEEFPELCEAEAKAFERVLGTRVQRLATLAHGAHVCTTFVPHATRHHDTSHDSPRFDLADTTAGNSLPTEGRR